MSSLQKKTIISVSINKKSVEKIIGRLLVQKRVCEQKLLQKTVCDRKTFDTQKVSEPRQREYLTKKLLFIVIHFQKNVDDKKVVLKIVNPCHSSNTRIKRGMMEICFVKISLYESF